MIAIQWQDKRLSLLDQSRYPQEEVWLDCGSTEEVVKVLSSQAIQDEKVAAIAGAYAYCLAALAHQDVQQTPAFDQALAQAKQQLLDSRAGARDMAAALDFMEHPPEAYTKNVDRLTTLLATAVTFERQQVVADRNTCRNGTDLMGEGTRVLVRADRGCFHSASPTGALGIVRRGYKREILEQITLCQGKPDGESLLAQELRKETIPCTILPDNAAATFLSRQGAHMVLCDGVLAAKNGDLKAPVGAYELAIVSYFHSIPFYAVLNADDVDLSLDSGAAFSAEAKPIEPSSDGIQDWAPDYDVIPAFLITGMITDRGIVSAPYEETLDELVKHTPRKLILNFDEM